MGLFSGLFGSKNEGTEKKIYITGMVCENCSNHVKESLKALPGVHNAKVNLTGGVATVYVDDTVTNDMLLKTVVNAGYGVTKVEP